MRSIATMLQTAASSRAGTTHPRIPTASIRRASGPGKLPPRFDFGSDRTVSFVTDEVVSEPLLLAKGFLICRYLADLIIGNFQDMVAAEIVQPLTATEVAPHLAVQASLGKAPLQSSNWANLSESCILDPDEVLKLVKSQNVRVSEAHTEEPYPCA